MLHDFSPFYGEYLEISGVRWYGLSYMVGFILSYYLILWLTRRQNVSITQEQISDFGDLWGNWSLSWRSFRLLLVYSPDLFLSFDSNFPFWGVLAVNKNGKSRWNSWVDHILFDILLNVMEWIHLYLFDLVAWFVGQSGSFFGRLANLSMENWSVGLLRKLSLGSSFSAGYFKLAKSGVCSSGYSFHPSLKKIGCRRISGSNGWISFADSVARRI